MKYQGYMTEYKSYDQYQRELAETVAATKRDRIRVAVFDTVLFSVVCLVALVATKF